MKKLLTTLLLIIMYSPEIGAYAANPPLPDSLLTVDYVYKYTFSDFKQAQQIIEQLRKKKSEPEYKLDIAEGDLYFNTGYYYRALHYHGRALRSVEVQADAEQHMEQLHRMISCYDCLHNQPKKAQYVEMLLKKAKECGDSPMQAIALFNMGKMLYYEGNKEKGYLYMQQATDQMRRTDYQYKYDNLRYNYNTLLVFQELDNRSKEAFQTLDELQKIVTDNTGDEVLIDGLNTKEQKAMTAHRAVILLQMGRDREADVYYKQFLSMGEPTDRDNYLIMPYLFGRELYDEVIRINSAREKTLLAQGDTVTYHMTSIKKSLGHAYREKGDYKRAAHYYEQLAILRDSIKNREQKSIALEMAAIYDANEKELRLHEQVAKIRIRTTGLAFVCCIVFLLGYLLWRTKRYNRTIRNKNKAMVSSIEELLGYKDELFLQKEKFRLLQGEPESVPAEAKESGTASASYDRILFDRIERKIISDKLFLRSDFSRSELLAATCVPKNKFAHLFRQFAGTNFPRYINNLRLEYATKILREYPDYTIEAISKACGMSTVQTFHRLFLEKFGVTPMEFRSGLKSTDK